MCCVQCVGDVSSVIPKYNTTFIWLDIEETLAINSYMVDRYPLLNTWADSFLVTFIQFGNVHWMQIQYTHTHTYTNLRHNKMMYSNSFCISAVTSRIFYWVFYRFDFECIFWGFIFRKLVICFYLESLVFIYWKLIE